MSTENEWIAKEIIRKASTLGAYEEVHLREDDSNEPLYGDYLRLEKELADILNAKDKSHMCCGKVREFTFQKRDDDCFRACISSILGIDYEKINEPDINLPTNEWLQAWRTYLNSIGFDIVFFSYEVNDAWQPKGYSIGVGISPRGKDHAVVCLDGKPIFDPYPNSTGFPEKFSSFGIITPTNIKALSSSSSCECGKLKDLIENNQRNLELERQGWTKTVQSRESECSRLRIALEDILDVARDCDCEQENDVWKTCIHCIAKEATHPQEPKFVTKCCNAGVGFRTDHGDLSYCEKCQETRPAMVRLQEPKEGE